MGRKVLQDSRLAYPGELGCATRIERKDYEENVSS
jgi:hypothetical protein